MNTYFFVEKARGNKSLNNIAQYLYLNVKPLFSIYNKMYYENNSYLNMDKYAMSKDKKKIAYICDEMTWCDFNAYSNSIFLHPFYWKEQLETFKPDILFCESAWSGIDCFKDVWRGRVYKDHRVNFENRKILLNIIAYCNENGINTVFWNKEDPVYLEHNIYDFSDTALKFANIFTTAEECIDYYKEKGHRNVHLLPFGVNCEAAFNKNYSPKKNTALFAGSWYGDNAERCKHLENILDYTLEKGLELDIIDRKSNSPEKRFRFPNKYNKYIKPAVSFTELMKICSNYEYAVNVNTVTCSKSMFSRRVLQMAACGLKIISNDAKGLDVLRDSFSIETVDEKKEIVLIKGSIDKIIEKHNTSVRFEKMINCL